MLDRIKIKNPALVKKILDNVDNDNIKTKVFFDPEIGNGEIVKAVEEGKRLAGCTDEEIYDTVIGYTSSQVHLNYIKKRMNLIGNYQVATYIQQGCYMKFDYAVTNPPYQNVNNKAKNNKLWPIFINKLMDQVNEGGFIFAVTPASVFNEKVGYGKKFKNRLDKNFSLNTANLHIEKQFNASITTADWSIQKSKVPDRIPYPILRNPIIDNILNKVLAYPNMMKFIIENNENLEGFKVIKDKTTKNPIIPPGAVQYYNSNKNCKYTFDTPINGGLKLVISFSSSYHGMFITDEPSGALNKVRYIESVEEGNNIISYANSMLFRFHANNYLKTAGYSPSVKNNKVPDLGSDRMWTDDEVFKEFKLTQDEIEYVKKTFVKKDSKSRKKP